MSKQRDNTPRNTEDEAVALGLAILVKDLAQPLVDLFVADDFHDRLHRLVYNTIKEVVDEGQQVNAHAVWARVKQNPMASSSVRLGDLVDLKHGVSGMKTRSDLMEVLGRLRPLTVRRRISAKCQVFSTQAMFVPDEHDTVLPEDQAAPGPQEILGMMESELNALEQLLNVRSVKRGAESLAEFAERVALTVERYHEGISSGVPTGLPELDAMLDGDGMQPQGMYVVSAPPGYGKTALACSIANHVACGMGHPVGIVTLEMSKEVYARRLFSIYSGIPFWMIRKGFYGREYETFKRLWPTFAQEPYIIDDSVRTIGGLWKTFRRMVYSDGAELLVLDYLQLVALSDKPARLGQRAGEVTEVSRQIKHMAQDLNKPILVVSNMNREQQREDRRPELIDLRESGQIEYDAESIWFLWNQNRHKGQHYEAPKVEDLTLMVAKQRNGPTGDVPVRFMREQMHVVSPRVLAEAQRQIELKEENADDF